MTNGYELGAITGVYTFIEFEPTADLTLAAKLSKEEFIQRYGVDPAEVHRAEMVLTPIKQIHLYTNHEKEFAHNGSIYNVYILFSIGLFVLLISSINFINLTIIRGFDRAKEIGLRKVVGANRWQLVLQFLAENAVILLLAGTLSLGLLTIFTPVLRNFSGLPLPVNVFHSPSLLLILVAILLGLQVLSGLYPAIILSGIQPADGLKSAAAIAPSGRIGVTRQVLVVLQFTLSIILVIGSLIVFQQLQYIQNKELGFEKDQIALIRLNKDVMRNYEAFEKQLITHPGIVSIATSSNVPGYRISLEGLMKLGDDTEYDSRVLFADETFIETYGMHLLRGKPFSKQISRSKNEFYLNEQAAKEFFPGQDPMGMKVIISGDTGSVIGIVQDFNFQSLHAPIEPLTIYNIPWAFGGFSSIKFQPSQVESVLGAIESANAEVYPNLPPVEVTFLDERFEQLYDTENQLKTIIFVFCIVTILLTISGLVGVASYDIRKRQKEIAIRKVLGCNIPQLMGLLSRNFVILLVIALLFGLPGAYFLSKWWLQDFAYQVPIQPRIFVLSGLIMMVVILNSSGLITLKAAMSNPAKTLKNE